MNWFAEFRAVTLWRMVSHFAASASGHRGESRTAVRGCGIKFGEPRTAVRGCQCTDSSAVWAGFEFPANFPRILPPLGKSPGRGTGFCLIFTNLPVSMNSFGFFRKKDCRSLRKLCRKHRILPKNGSGRWLSLAGCNRPGVSDPSFLAGVFVCGCGFMTKNDDFRTELI